MSIAQAHLDIARERFLETMAQYPNGDARTQAIAAIEQADEFVAAYELLGYKPVEQAPRSAKMKGCKACFGSGGKHGDPCKACTGTGKVAA